MTRLQVTLNRIEGDSASPQRPSRLSRLKSLAAAFLITSAVVGLLLAALALGFFIAALCLIVVAAALVVVIARATFHRARMRP